MDLIAPGALARFRRALVTGGAGFIGSHLVDALLAAGVDTVVLDNLSGGLREQVPAGARLIVMDVADPLTVELVADARPDLVIHAAAQVSVSASMSDSDRDRAVNLAGTQHVLDGAHKAGAKRLVFISSGGAIYGDSSGADESSVPAPENYYGIHKLAAEGYVRVSGLSYGIVRFANVYGPRQRAGLEGGVVAIFVDALRRGAGVTIYGTGDQTRDFLHVHDAVSGALTVAASDRDGIWNIGTGSAVSISSLLDEVAEITGTHPEIRREPRRAGDVDASRLFVGRIRDQLGWSPRVSLHDGLADLVLGTH